MKRLLIITLVVSATTLLGFWGSRKVCVMMCPTTLKSSPMQVADLQLSTQQANAFGQLESGFNKEVDQLCMDLCAKRSQLLEMIGAQNADTAAVDKTIAEIAQIQGAVEKAAATRICESVKILNPQQQKTYVSGLRKQLGSCVKSK